MFVLAFALACSPSDRACRDLSVEMIVIWRRLACTTVRRMAYMHLCACWWHAQTANRMDHLYKDREDQQRGRRRHDQSRFFGCEMDSHLFPLVPPKCLAEQLCRDLYPCPAGNVHKQASMEVNRVCAIAETYGMNSLSGD
jgi:hypothetical protein